MPITPRPTATAPAAMAILEHEVAAFDAWKQTFESYAAGRRSAGILSARVSRSADAPNAVTVCLASGSFEALDAFFAQPERRALMERGGVLAPPRTTLAVPVDDLTVRDRPVAGAFVRARVADFDAWKRGFDARAAARANAGIIGHAIARAKDDPSEVIIVLQAEDVDTLRRFTSSDDLRRAMTETGVQAPPRVSFVQSFAVEP